MNHFNNIRKFGELGIHNKDLFDDIGIMYRDLHNLHAEENPELYRLSSLKTIQDFLKDYDYIIHYYLIDEKAVALVSYKIINNVDHPMFPAIKYINIGAIYTTPQYRHRGIASALIDYVVRVANNQGIDEFKASVKAFNDPSHRLLFKYGFLPSTTNYALNTHPTFFK